MRFGMNLLMWTDTLNDEMLPLLDEMKADRLRRGRDPVFDLDNVDNYAKWGKRFDDARPGRAPARRSAARDDNPISPDPAVRRKGVEANKRNAGLLRGGRAAR